MTPVWLVWLVSAQAGDKLPGRTLDVALLDNVAALRQPAVQAWMAEQGYSPDDPGECMYLAVALPPEGFPSLELHLSAADAAAFLGAIDRDDALQAALEEGSE